MSRQEKVVHTDLAEDGYEEYLPLMPAAYFGITL
jgi:hypothetical protein